MIYDLHFEMLIRSPEEMFALGKEMAQKHTKILLHGELWAGKTTFAKGFAEWLGIDPMIVQSPTYTYLHEYENKLLHIDMYRLELEEEIVQKGILEIIERSSHIIIEWPKFESLYTNSERQTLTIDKISPELRDIKNEKIGTA